ncbi:MAG: prolyl oligopeptidase family serine peptidase [Gemmatimonadota bacterium]
MTASTLCQPMARTALVLLILSASALSAQQATNQKASEETATGKRTLEISDYARWRSIQSPQITEDGQWAAWVYTQIRRDDQLVVQHIDSGRKYTVERASRPVFSDDGRWVAYSVAPTIKEIDKLEKDKKPIPRRAELMNLQTGEKVGWDNAASFEFAKGSSHLVIKKARPEPKPKHEGVDLILRDLAQGREELIGAVFDNAFNKPGALLAYTVDAADRAGNGLFLVELGTGVRRALDNGDAQYTRLLWSEDGTALAALRGKDADTLTQRPNTLIVHTGVVAGRAPARIELTPEAAGLPAQHVISNLAALSWSESNDRLFFGVKAQEAKPKKSEEEEWLKASDVDVFHWKDDRIQSVQRRQVEQDKNRTARIAFELATKKLVRLSDATIRNVQITRDGRWGIVTDDRAYVSDWQEARADYYRVNTSTGERTPILKGHIRTLGLAPDSRRFLYWKDQHIWSYDLVSGQHLNLTAKTPVSFADQEFDRGGERPPYAVAGYAKDGKSVILDGRYDLWLIPFDGSAGRNLTNGLGGERELRFRYQRTDPEERFIDLTRPLLLSAYGTISKQSGFYELRGGRMNALALEDKAFGGLNKAARAERYLFTRESWSEFPDVQVAGAMLKDAKKLTDANPQQAEYRWGRRILFDYTNKDGVKLQGTLALPEDYQPGQKLPMLVNFYEKNSQNLHRYPTPRYASSPQFAGYVSNGYLVMQPDIHFRGRTSHSDMLECVEAAIQKVIELGYADPRRVGLHGHSYSGGGASYIATRSKMFAAIVAGAAPINLVNEFNIIFRGSGQNNHRYDIYGQGRYLTNPYDDFDLYWAQSPISGVRTMNTPLLYMHGGDDPTVEYNQGLEFYNALRFNSKPVIFLSYPAEGHGLGKLENQVDYLNRMEQFYGHHLRGEPAPAWMTEGEPFINKDRRKPIPINVAKPVTTTTAAGRN